MTARETREQRPLFQRAALRVEPSESSRVLSGLIFTVSSAMVGVCLTVVGLLNIVQRAKGLDKAADVLVASDALAFLGSCVLAYLALRTTTERRWRLLERAADALFLLGLFVMVVIATMIATDIL